MAKYLLTASTMNYGLSTTETHKLAYLDGVQNKMKVPGNRNNNKAGSHEWLRIFMSRNNKLSLRTPKATSLGRATAFNKHTVQEFFKLLQKVLELEQFGPEAIYSCDETGVQIAHKPSKIISQKGQKQVSKMTSYDRGQTVTVCCCVSVYFSAGKRTGLYDFKSATGGYSDYPPNWLDDGRELRSIFATFRKIC